MNDILVKGYCLAHRSAKKLLGRAPSSKVHYCYAYSTEDVGFLAKSLTDFVTTVNGSVHGAAPLAQSDLFYGENAIMGAASLPIQPSPSVPQALYSDAPAAWAAMVDASAVPTGWRNSGFRTVCYERKRGQWCLSSWIWTSAAVARYYATLSRVNEVVVIADAFLASQHSDGGWVVRFDYLDGKTSPMLAPNDSCYVARNALLPAWRLTGDMRYLAAARHCADWTISTAAPSGLVYLGLNTAAGEWVTDRNIVDSGFTAALFAELYEATGELAYRDFLEQFTDAYIDGFYDASEGAFFTNYDNVSRRGGGHFARGQAWALEGLVPAYRVLGSHTLREVIESVVRYLIAHQSQDGSWAYNLTRPLAGNDCKGTPVIARALASWGREEGDGRAVEAARKALAWCEAHTDLDGTCPGGIFSYCLEGAVTHYLYSEAAFVYASSYALETLALLECSNAEQGVR